MYTICCESFDNPLMEELLFEEHYSPVERCFRNIDQIIEENFAPSIDIDDIESEMFGEAKSESSASKFTPNAVAKKLGNAIRTLIEKLKEMGKKFLNLFMKQDKELDKMSAEMKRVIREHPELKDQIILNAKEGSLLLKDINDIKEFEKEYQKMMAEKDPSKLKAALAKLKNKWDDPEGSKTIKRVAAAATVVGLATGVFTLIKKIDEAKDICAKANQRDMDDAADLMHKFTELKRAEGLTDSEIISNINIHKARIELHSKVHGKLNSRLANHSNGLLGKCGKFLDKVSGGKYGKRKRTKNAIEFYKLKEHSVSKIIQDQENKINNAKTNNAEAYHINNLSDSYKMLRNMQRRQEVLKRSLKPKGPTLPKPRTKK